MSKSQNKEEGEPKKESMDRRRFFVIVGNSAVGLVTAGSLGMAYDFLSPKVLLEISSRFRAGTPETIPPDTMVYDAEHRVFVFRDTQGYFYAISANCTHLGCTANWKAEGVPGHEEGVIACPCHGSIFSKTGNVITGPAPRAMDRFRMYIEDNKLFVDTNETVSEEEMVLKV
jgi:cytochrome b6-f complex iron-sulfur subunit